MPAPEPVVSVLIGAYDNEATVADAIASILAQSERRLELIVIDDGSSDRTASAATEAIDGDERCRLVRLPENLGIAASLNAGLERATAPVVAIQDADDYSEPRRLERQLAVLAADPEIAVVGARMREVDPGGRPLRPRTRMATGDAGAALMRFNAIPNGVAMFRRADVVELGGYDARYRYAAEYDLWLRVAERRRIVILDEVLATRVMGSTNVAARADREQTGEVILLLARAMRRRRSLGAVPAVLRAIASYLTPRPLKRALHRRRGQAI